MASSRRKKSKKRSTKNDSLFNKIPKQGWIAIIVIVAGLVIIGLMMNGSGSDNQSTPDPEVIAEGKEVFETSCAACHGPNGEGSIGPPLNGSGHSWHHPDAYLENVITNGIPNSQMTGFGDRLSQEDINAVIQYFQNWWSDEQLEMQQRRQDMMN